MVLRLSVVLAIGIGHTSALHEGRAGKPLVVGTWNVLSKSKATSSASGFPGYDINALKAHNKKGWITTEILAMFNAFNVKLDILFLQEIDQPLYEDLKQLKGKYGLMPITGDGVRFKMEKKYPSVLEEDEGYDGALTVEGLLSKSFEGKEKAIPKDFAFVVWRTATISELSCEHPWKTKTSYPKYKTTNNNDGSTTEEEKEFDMSKIGICSVRLVGGESDIKIVAMHADGDKGFTVEQARSVNEQVGGVHLVIGDMNVKSPATLRNAVNGMKYNRKYIFSDLIVPSYKCDYDGKEWEPEYCRSTVYRRIHAYRKFIQAFENGKIVDRTSSALALECKKVEGGAMKCNYAEGLSAIKAFLKTKKAGGSKVEKELAHMYKMYDMGPQEERSREQIREAHATIWVDLELHEDIKWPDDKELSPNANIMISPFDRWTRLFPKAMHIRPEDLGLAMPMAEAKRLELVADEIKREDWYAYDEKTFQLIQESVLGEEKSKNTAKAHGDLPSKAMPSDHLPVIVQLKNKKSKSSPSGPSRKMIEDIGTLEKENTALKKENTALKEENTALKEENTALKENYAEMDSDIDTLEKENTALKEKIDDLNSENTALKKENTALKEEIDHLNSRKLTTKEKNKINEDWDRLIKKKNTARSDRLKHVAKSFPKKILKLVKKFVKPISSS